MPPEAGFFMMRSTGAARIPHAARKKIALYVNGFKAIFFLNRSIHLAHTDFHRPDQKFLNSSSSSNGIIWSGRTSDVFLGARRLAGAAFWGGYGAADLTGRVS